MRHACAGTAGRSWVSPIGDLFVGTVEGRVCRVVGSALVDVPEVSNPRGVVDIDGADGVVASAGAREVAVFRDRQEIAVARRLLPLMNIEVVDHGRRLVALVDRSGALLDIDFEATRRVPIGKGEFLQWLRAASDTTLRQEVQNEEAQGD
jgi:hypothetical protein